MKSIWDNWDYSKSWWVNLLACLIAIVVVLGAVFGVMCLNSWLIMLLWNAILPVVFGLSALTFWQTFGLYLLLWLLTGGFKKVFNIFTNTD